MGTVHEKLRDYGQGGTISGTTKEIHDSFTKSDLLEAGEFKVSHVIASVENVEEAHRLHERMGLKWPIPGIFDAIIKSEQYKQNDANRSADRVAVFEKALELARAEFKNRYWLLAIQYGRLGVMDFMSGVPRIYNLMGYYGSRVIDEAATYGQLPALQWLKLNLDMIWSATAMACAAAGGHLNVMIWLRAQIPRSPYGQSMLKAAENGHLDVVKWLRAQDPPCEWNAAAVSSAAKNGHLGIVQWLRAQDPPCPWDSYAEQRARDHFGDAEVDSWSS